MTKIKTLTLSLLFAAAYGGTTTTTTIVDIGFDTNTGLCESQTIYNTVYVDSVVETNTPAVKCVSQAYDSKFTGRLLDPYGVPHKRVSIKAQGDTWVSQAMTDDNGKYTIDVKGDSKFYFSAYGMDYDFYAFDVPLSVKAGNTSPDYVCEYDIDTLFCHESSVISG